MSTTELSDVFEFHLTPTDPSLREDDVQRLLEAAVAQAVHDSAAVQSASADIQGNVAPGGEAVVVLHVVLAKDAANPAARTFVDTSLTSQLEQRRVVISHVMQRNTSGDN